LEFKQLYNKRVCPTKNETQQLGISYLEREREPGGGEREKEGVRERGGGQQVDRSAGRHN
jgi:hypothetical protein